MQFPLGLLPWSLTTADGVLAKTNKAALLHMLEGDFPLVEHVPPAVFLIDGMALLQALQVTKCDTFGDI